MGRTINTSSSAVVSPIGPPVSQFHGSKFPKACHKISKECRSLTASVRYEIDLLEQILQQTLSSKATVGTRNHDDNPTISENIEDIQNAIDDGFMLCDLNVVQRKLKAWKIMFPRIKPFFAIKCNPDCMVSHVLGQTCSSVCSSDASGADICNCCCGFDCASLPEIQLALRSSQCEANKNESLNNIKKCIVYANPQRSMRDLDRALELGVNALTFDSVEELDKVKDAYDRMKFKYEEEKAEGTIQHQIINPPEMILRIVVPDNGSTVPLGEKFGVDPNNVKQFTRKALELGLDVIGVSFHCGSGNHEPLSYKDAIFIAKECIDEMNEVLKQHGKDVCSILDIGGGYPGYDGVGGDFCRFDSYCNDNTLAIGQSDKYSPDTESTYKIAQIVSPLVNDLFPSSENFDIISEPGRYFVEAAFAYCARIYSVKNQASGVNSDLHKIYYIAQGVQGLFKDVILCDEIFTPIPLQLEKCDESNQTLFPSTILGPSGEDFDIVCKDCMLPDMDEGDWLIFDRMGAYTLSIAARNSSLPIRYVMGGSQEIQDPN